jgi:hypothetical protein
MADNVGLRDLRAELAERQDRGVQQVRIGPLLKRLDEIAASVRSGRRRRNGKLVIGPGDLIGSYEAAQLLKVDRTRPSKWRKVGTTFGPDKIRFPEPIAVLEGSDPDKPGTPVYLRSEVEKLIPFVEARRRHRD